jgi:hypothetical protein
VRVSDLSEFFFKKGGAMASNKEKKLECDKCDFETLSKPGLKAHITKKHNGTKRVQEDQEVEAREDEQKKHKEGEDKGKDEQEEGQGTEPEDDEDEEDWYVGDKVYVRLTGLYDFPDFLDFEFCHMNGTIEKLNQPSETHATVKLEQCHLSLEVEVERLTRVRDAENGVKWKKGDKVLILETNKHVSAWWEATIIGPKGKKWKVEWVGKYEGHEDEALVSKDKIRRAEP